jgi:eukaryotic-like serine/threonine-protein kinase
MGAREDPPLLTLGEAERLYAEARLLSIEERAAYLEAACAGRPALLAELTSLVEHGDAAESFFRLLRSEIASLPSGLDAAMGTSEADGPTQRALPPGASVGRYRILELIGAGGMGTVYRAHDPSLDRDVALKLLPGHLTGDVGARERFLLEARAAASLDHPNICTIHEVGEDQEERLFIAMAFYPGETLKERLRRGRMEPAEALSCATQLARGLDAAHRRGVVHRDVKPGNVMLLPDGTVKLLDFGLARIADVTLTQPGVLPGTVAYMSPEQLRGEAVDRQTDLFSLGVVLYEMLAGVRPFRGDGAAALRAAILHDDPAPLDAVAPSTPEAASCMVERLLRKDPTARYATAGELLGDLARQGNLRTGARRFSSARRRMVLAAALAVVIVVAAAFLALWPRSPTSSPAAVPEIRRLAVLPLANHTGDAAQDYFVDGMHDALLAELGRMPDLVVISRQSVLRYRGSDMALPAIARELDVDALVEGAVFRSGDSVRVTVQLVRGEPEQHLWVSAHRGALADALAVQQDVAMAIGRALHTRLRPAERAPAATSGHPATPEAQEAYLRGLYYMNLPGLGTRSWEESLALMQRGAGFLEEATSLDPGWPAAHAKLALAYHFLASGPWGMGEEFYPRAKAAALKALELDDTEAQAHASLGFVLSTYERDWEAAESSIRRALELEGNAYIHWIYALYLGAVARHDDAIAHYRLAEERNPLSRQLKVHLAEEYFCAGRYEEAVGKVREILMLWPEQRELPVQPLLAIIHSARSAHAEAIVAAEQAATLGDRAPKAVEALAYVKARAGARVEARRLRAWLEAEHPEFSYVAIDLALGETDSAIDGIATAVRDGKRPGVHERDRGGLGLVRCLPEWDAVRGDPRIRSILSRLRLAVLT